jgi:hypothetical protein
MKEIGGYFEIEYSNTNLGIHPNAIKLNTARNCLEYILLAKGYTNVYVPYYTCDVVLEPLIKHNVSYTFYYINENLEPAVLPELKKNEAFLYTNYFGLKDQYIISLQQSLNNLIIDNSQALYAPNTYGIDTFYSLRKFVGTPDGAFLYCNKTLNDKFKAATSFDRVSHLYKRKDKDAGFGFEDFKKNDKALAGLPVMIISSSTKQFILTYDFEKNKLIRERNFLLLHSKLHASNKFAIDTNYLNGPLCYPLLISEQGLKKKLIQQKIFVPTYWPNVKEWIQNKDCFEKKLIDTLVCLPVDQRYSVSDMRYLLKLIDNIDG